MKASSILKLCVRALMITFLFFFVYNLFSHTSNSIDYNVKLRSLQLTSSNTDIGATWVSKDQILAQEHLKKSQTNLTEMNVEQFNKEIQTAKALIAEEIQTKTYSEIEKYQKAFENMQILKKSFESISRKNQKFVRLITKNNPMLLGHVVEENADSVSVKDTDGFVIPIHRKNILDMQEISNQEKEKLYADLLKKVMDDNGKTSSYGLYLSAKWAYENGLDNRVNGILADAVLNDSQILSTIADNESRKLLTLANWSNLVGDLEDAKEKAQLVISNYPQTEQAKEAREVLALITKNIEKTKEAKLLALERQKEAENLAKTEEIAKKQEEKFANAPEIPATTEPTPIAQEEASKPKNTLALKKSSYEEVNKAAVIQTPDKSKQEGIEEKIIERENKKIGKNALFEEKNYQDANELVNEGKDFMRKANAFENPGNKNAQANFRLALKKFEEAKAKLDQISKKYGGKDDFDDLYGQASGMDFFIRKSCLRLK